MSRDYLTDAEVLAASLDRLGEVFTEMMTRLTAAVEAFVAAAVAIEDDEPSEAELIAYYHSGGGEDPVSRQQIRDAGRPGL